MKDYCQELYRKNGRKAFHQQHKKTSCKLATIFQMAPPNKFIFLLMQQSQDKCLRPGVRSHTHLHAQLVDWDNRDSYSCNITLLQSCTLTQQSLQESQYTCSQDRHEFVCLQEKCCYSNKYLQKKCNCYLKASYIFSESIN